MVSVSWLLHTSYTVCLPKCGFLSRTATLVIGLAVDADIFEETTLFDIIFKQLPLIACAAILFYFFQLGR